MNKDVKEYITQYCGIAEKDAEKIAEDFSRHKSIETEFAVFAMRHSFPTHSFAEVNGYTAQFIYKKYKVTPLIAYAYLADMEDDPETVIADLHQEGRRISPPIEVIAEKNGLFLIRKYGLLYIRFTKDGKTGDVLISAENSERAVTDPFDLEEIFEEEIKRYDSTYALRRSAIFQYLLFWEEMTAENAEEWRDMLFAYGLDEEFYKTLMKGQFPDKGTEVNGITAKNAFEAFGMSLWESYAYLMYLTEQKTAGVAE